MGQVLPWLQRGTSDFGAGTTTGFDLGGWDANGWLLHTMYELPDASPSWSYDDVEREEITTGTIEPLVVGDVNLSESTLLTGIPLGRTTEPEGGWVRLRWSELARRASTPMNQSGVPPCHKWFSFSSWPTNIRPPSEGSLDPVALRGIVEVLASHSVAGLDTHTVFFFAMLAVRKMDGPRAFSGTLSELTDLYGNAGVTSSPSNFWPSDQSWFVYTDYDLMGTKVSGDDALLEALRRHPQLEVVNYP